MAKVIMVQGTTSNAGKSFLAAALCRIFYQDGYSVAPFKSQNMALNSYITRDGLEMGRAQVMQAQAAGIEPVVQMNPILLKPTTDVGSQVIVNGVPLANMHARDYFKIKRSLIPEIRRAFDTLAKNHDIIVIEGAGSPAEINLKQDDIVNMGLARLVDAPVILCADIDRGGVFASLYGTVALLEKEEQQRIRGLVINNFRGDKTILDPGVVMLEELTGKPVVGVIPHMEVDLDDEDSLSSRFESGEKKGLVEVAVIRLPHISNFTDFNSLERLESVSLRYVSRPAQLGNPDVIILPGTKNTLHDLKWLKESGMETVILRQAIRGVGVVGICGGFQMLGQQVSDPEGVEGGGTMKGLGLLPTRTLFGEEKSRTRVSGVVNRAEGMFAGLQGATFQGYEIHMGQTTGDMDFARLEQGDTVTLDGACRGNVWGTYVHGIFDSGAFAQAFVNCLLEARGLSAEQGIMDWQTYQQLQYDKLADGVRRALDMDRIYRILEGTDED